MDTEPCFRFPAPVRRRAYAACMLLLVAIWAAAGRGYFWPMWPMIVWGFGLLTRSAGMAAPGRHTARVRERRRDRFHWA